MKESSKYFLYKWSTVIGSFFILFPIGIVLYWGNMSTYVLSYVLSATSSGKGLQKPWVLTLYIIGRSAGLVVSEVIEHVATRGKWVVVLSGIALFNGAIFGSYFSVSISMAMMNFTLGALVGISFGILEGTAIRYVLDWSDSNGTQAALISIVFSACPAGAVVINSFVTLYINPDDKYPNVGDEGEVKYFSQTDILQRVPTMFLYFGLGSLGLQLIGFLMLKDGSSWKKEKEATTSGELTAINCIPNQATKTSCNTVHGDGSLTGNETELVERIVDTTSYSLLDMIRSRQFLVLWIGYTWIDPSIVITFNYYKTYGQVHINDDHLISAAGTTISFLSIVSTALWGFVLDYKISAKTGILLLVFIISITDSFFYISPMVHKTFYFIVAVTDGCLCSLLYPTFIIALLRIFGVKNVNMKIGIFSISAVFTYCVCTAILDKMFHEYGWFSIFLLESSLGVMCMILITFFLPS